MLLNAAFPQFSFLRLFQVKIILCRPMLHTNTILNTLQYKELEKN